MEKRLNAIRK